MAELVHDCPRCGTKKITFDASAAHLVGIEYGWKETHEVFAVCRHCNRSTIFVLCYKDHHVSKMLGAKSILEAAGGLNHWTVVRGYISLKDRASDPPPDHLPGDLEAAFREGATCIAVGCHNAAGTMFRLCLDLATRPLLPADDEEGLNAKIRRDLGLRLPWLFDKGYLPEGLRGLSACIKNHGNDGAHAGTLTADDAADLLDFTYALLERLYTEPARVKLAEDRLAARRAKK